MDRVVAESIRILSKIYPKVVTLKDFIKDIINATLLHEDPDFDAFLDRCLVTFPRITQINLQACPSSLGLYFHSLYEAVNDCYKMRRWNGGLNILVRVKHHYFIDEFTKYNSLENETDVKEYFYNCHMQHVFALIGRNCFHYLLTECSLFECFQSSICLQRSGIPVDVVPKLKNRQSDRCTSDEHAVVLETLCPYKGNVCRSDNTRPNTETCQTMDVLHKCDSISKAKPTSDPNKLESKVECAGHSKQPFRKRSIEVAEASQSKRSKIDSDEEEFFTALTCFATLDEISNDSDNSLVSTKYPADEAYYPESSQMSNQAEFGHPSTSTCSNDINLEHDEQTKEGEIPFACARGINETEAIDKQISDDGRQEIEACSISYCQDDGQQHDSSGDLFPECDGYASCHSSFDSEHDAYELNCSANVDSQWDTSIGVNSKCLGTSKADLDTYGNVKKPNHSHIHCKASEPGVMANRYNNTKTSGLKEVDELTEMATKSSHQTSSDTLNEKHSKSLKSNVHKSSEPVIIKGHKRTKTRRGKRGRRLRCCMAPAKTTVLIGRYFILHHRNLSEKPLETCILTHIHATKDGADSLCKEIFESAKHVGSCCPLLPAQKDCLCPLLCQMIRQFHSWHYDKALQKICPISEDPKVMTSQELLMHSLSTENVMDFLHDMFVAVVPVELLGSIKNFEIFVQHLRTLIVSGKKDSLYLHMFTAYIKAVDIKWLSQSPYCRYQVDQLVYWLIKLALCILGGFFYITEKANTGHQLYFYRKTIWRELHKRGIKSLTEEGILKRLESSDPKEKLLLPQHTAAWIPHLIRFLPKTNSLRPIIAQNPKDKSLEFYYRALQTIFSCKTFNNAVSTQFPKSNIDDFVRKFKALLNARAETKDKRHLYFVKADIKNCYTNIKQEKLIKLCREILRIPNVPSFQIVKVVQVVQKGENLWNQYVWQATPCNEQTSNIVNEFASSNTSVATIQKVIGTLGLEMQVYLLETYIKKSLILDGTDVYLMEKGIHQGGKLSAILCDWYLAALVKEHLNNFGNANGEQLMRVMDDFLFITPDIDKAHLFLQKMCNGFEDFGVSANAEKLATNFDLSLCVPLEPSKPTQFHGVYENTKKLSSSMNILKPNEPMKYVGLAINHCNLSINLDYSKYMGKDIRYFVALSGKNPLISTRRKLLLFVQSATPACILDVHINSKATVIENIFERFLFMSCLFHRIYMYQLGANRQFPAELIHVIVDIADAMRKRIRSYVSQKKISLHLPLQQIFYICFKAFLIILDKYPSQYLCVRSSLQTLISNYAKEIPRKKRRRIDKIVRHVPVNLMK